jgi:thiamine-phosphate pyrophosphorylase
MGANKIYALCDIETLLKRDISLQQFLDICANLNIIFIQYRDKISNIQTQKENLLFLKSNCNIPVIINDKLELLEFCDGLHLGQEDLETVKKNKLKVKNNDLVFKFLRKKYPNKIFGLSTHNELEILEANSLLLNYIGLGSYRQTSTKDTTNIIGDNISYLAKISKHPVGAIGGVKIDDNIENISYNVVGSGLF